METFLENIAEFLDADQEITAETRMDSLEEWDSVSIVSFLAMVNVEYGKSLRVADFSGAETFQDLYDIVMKK